MTNSTAQNFKSDLARQAFEVLDANAGAPLTIAQIKAVLRTNLSSAKISAATKTLVETHGVTLTKTKNGNQYSVPEVISPLTEEEEAIFSELDRAGFRAVYFSIPLADLRAEVEKREAALLMASAAAIASAVGLVILRASRKKKR